MNVQQMRQEMQEKYDKLSRMKTQIEGSGRKPTQAERDQAEGLLNEITDLDISIRTEETGEFLHSSIRPPTRPDVNFNPTVFSSGTPGKYFRSFGEQLIAIRNASMPGNQPDGRLYEVRAATGLSESVPGDGGFLIEQSVSRDIITSAFANGQLAKLCRPIAIGENSNSVKVNAVSETSRVSARWGGIIGYFLGEASSKIASAPKFRQMEMTLKKFVCLCYEQNMAHMPAMV